MHVAALDGAPNRPDLQGLVDAILDRRLQADTRRPIAAALSGGGDSLALLLAADAWARRAGRDILVLSVDHGLQPQSAGWTDACASTATRLGWPFRALAWVGDKPATGLSAAARLARHRLLADAARAAGARVILMGHTADDSLEAQLMRTRGATTSEPREWAPSPVWPHGRGLFLLRPLMDLKRAEIRAWLTARGERWIDDPANESPLSLRAQVRRDIARGAAPGVQRQTAGTAHDLALTCDMDAAGGLRIVRQALRATPTGGAARFVSMACLCAAGTDRPPTREAAVRLAERLAGEDGLTAGLAGARVEADGEEVRFLREAGEAARGGLQPLTLAAGETGVWDGRFEIVADRGIEVRSAAGLRPQLSADDQARLATLPASARDVMPVVVAKDELRLADARPLTLERLLAACGAVDREPA